MVSPDPATRYRRHIDSVIDHRPYRPPRPRRARRRPRTPHPTEAITPTAAAPATGQHPDAPPDTAPVRRPANSARPDWIGRDRHTPMTQEVRPMYPGQSPRGPGQRRSACTSCGNHPAWRTWFNRDQAIRGQFCERPLGDNQWTTLCLCLQPCHGADRDQRSDAKWTSLAQF